MHITKKSNLALVINRFNKNNSYIYQWDDQATNPERFRDVVTSEFAKFQFFLNNQ